MVFLLFFFYLFLFFGFSYSEGLIDLNPGITVASYLFSLLAVITFAESIPLLSNMKNTIANLSP